MAINRRYRCRYCGDDFPAALPVTQEPNGAMLRNHVSAMHPTAVGPYLRRMATREAMATVAAEAYEVVDEDGHEGATKL
jgi:hypothetical protein